jgi:hypothetical protein
VRWPNKLFSFSITFHVIGTKWLINALNEEQKKANQAMHEVGKLEKVIDYVILEIKTKKEG